MKAASALLCGWLFAVGLGVAGMTQPLKIIGFLNITGTWDPSLVFVMGGAVAVGLLSFAWVLKRRSPVFEAGFALPEKTGIDSSLLAGAGLFGVGWGLSGYCPGPALVSLVSGSLSVWVFVLAMLAGLAVGQWLAGKK